MAISLDNEILNPVVDQFKLIASKPAIDLPDRDEGLFIPGILIDRDPQGKPGVRPFPHVALRMGIHDHGAEGRLLLFQMKDRKSTRLNSTHVAISYAVS